MGTNKSAVRVAIEKILRTKFDTVYVDATTKKKTKYRIKFVSDAKATPKQIDKIMKLPNVLKINYYYAKSQWSSNGITVYFNTKLSNIIL